MNPAAFPFLVRKDVVTASCVLVTLLSVSPAAADPVTVGTWSPVPALMHNGTPWFDRTSADCYTCAVGYYLPPAAEYLHAQNGEAVGFGFEGWRNASIVGAVSDYAAAGRFSYDGLSFSYDNGHGFTSSSWQRTHMALFRLVEDSRITYWLGIEDLPASARGIDWDYNDLILQMVVDRPSTRIVPSVTPPRLPPPAGPTGGVPSPAPEPGALIMVATGLGMAVRYLRVNAVAGI
jgi:hypothetical protein